MKQPIRIVLVDPSHPGNVGAAARAMKNMGLSELVLVRPKEFPSEEATVRASQAADLLERARVTDTIAAAIDGCGLVLGTSARPRSANWTVLATFRKSVSRSRIPSVRCAQYVVMGMPSTSSRTM